MSKLFIANVPSMITEEDLKKHFKQIGNVVSVRVILPSRASEARGFAFVEMQTAKEAKKAIEMLYGKEVKGVPLYIREAQPKRTAPRPKGGVAS